MTLKKLKLIERTLLLLLFFVTVSMNLSARSANSGKEFYIAFGKNDTVSTVKNSIDNRNVELILRIAALEDTEVALSFTEDPALDATFRVFAGKVRDYRLSAAQARASYSGTDRNRQMPGKKSIRVTASNPITLVAMNSANQSVEATLVLPVENLGNEYIHVGMDCHAGSGKSAHGSGYLIIATEDNTVITHVASPGSEIPNLTLQKGEVYFFDCSCSSNRNPMGMHIVSDKPIAYFQSGSRSVIDNRYNYTFEQIPPVNQWGTQFILPTNEMDAGFVRIYPKEIPTTVTVRYSNDTENTFVIDNSGISQRYRDIRIDNNNNRSAQTGYITADKPISVCAYHIPRWGGESQPGAAWLPSVEQRTTGVLVSPLDFNGKHVDMRMEHYFTIIVPTAGKNNTTLSVDGTGSQPIQNLPGFSWVADNIGGSGYSLGRYFFGESNGGHTPQLNTTAWVDNPEGVLLLAYGQGSHAHYFYSIGYSTHNLLSEYTIRGTVSGLPYNAGIAVNYTINGGEQQNVVTTDGGAYTIPNVPSGANVIITGSMFPGYSASVSPTPNTSNATSNLTNKNIEYSRNVAVSEYYTQVLSCASFFEIDVLSKERYSYDRNNMTISMIEQPKYAEPISDLNDGRNLEYIPTVNFQGIDDLKFEVTHNGTVIDTVLLYINAIDCPDKYSKYTGMPETQPRRIN